MSKRKILLEYRAGILKALADPARLEIIELLKDGEKCVCEIIPMLGKTQSTTSKHLDILYREGILDRRIDGKRTLYCIKDPKKIFQLLKMIDSLILDKLSPLTKTVKILKSFKS